MVRRCLQLRLAARAHHNSRRLSQYLAAPGCVCLVAPAHSLSAHIDEHLRFGDSGSAGLLSSFQSLCPLVAAAHSPLASCAVCGVAERAGDSYSLTNAPFHFALLAFLVAVAAPPENWGWKIFDVCVLAISALSGPFCIVLFPLVFVFWFLRRERWRLVVMAACCPSSVCRRSNCCSAATLTARPRSWEPRQSSSFVCWPADIYIGSFWGENGFARHYFPIIAILVSIAGTCVLVYTLLRCTLELRLFIAFALALFAAGLSKPLIEGPMPQWQLLTIVASGRYWFMPMLAFIWSMLFCATQSDDRIVRIGTRIAFITLLHGLVHDHRYPPYPDQNFKVFLRQFETAPAGTLVALPDCPPGQSSYLRKK